MKLKGHKPGCRCVGCSAETRERGLSRARGGLKRKMKARRRSHRNPARTCVSQTCASRRVPAEIKAIYRGGKVGYYCGGHIRVIERAKAAGDIVKIERLKIGNPLDKREAADLIRRAKIHAKVSLSAGAKRGPKDYIRGLQEGLAAAYADAARSFSRSRHVSKAAGKIMARVYKGDRKKHDNPLTRQEAAIAAKYARYLHKQSAKGGTKDRRAYYLGRAQGIASVVTTASSSKQARRVGMKIGDKAGRAYYGLPNPAARGPYIGENPTLRFDTGRALRFGGAKLYAGKDASSIVMIGAPHSAGIAHIQVRAIEYDNRAKALRAYGRPGRFIHTFKRPVSVTSAGSGIVVMKSTSRIWRSNL